MRDRQSGGGGGRLSSPLDLCPSFCFPACLSQSHITSLIWSFHSHRNIPVSLTFGLLSTGCFIQESVRQDWTKAQSWCDKWLPCSMSSFYFLFFLTVCFWWHSVFTYHGLWRCKKKNRVFGYVKSRTPGTNRFIHRGQSQRTYQGTVCTRVHLQLLHICLHTLDGY